MTETAEQLVDMIWREYGLHVRAIQRLAPVWRLESDLGPLCLKRVAYDEGKLRFICLAMEHLRREGFSRSPELLPARRGRRWLPHQDVHGEGWLFLTDWVADRPCDFLEEGHIAAATTTLAEFHQYAKGFDGPGLSRRRAHWQRWPRLLAGRTADLNRYAAMDEGTLAEQELLKAAVQQAQLAVTVLDKSQYRRLAAEACAEKSFVHRDVAARNFVLNYRDEANLIDFDYCRWDLRLADVARLLDRTLRSHRWSFSLGQRILSVYEETSPLHPDEYPVLLALLIFPQRFWRLCRRRYEGLLFDRTAFRRDLRQWQGEQRQKSGFLRRFAEEYCWGFLHRHDFNSLSDGATIAGESDTMGLPYQLDLYKRFFPQPGYRN